MGRVGWCNHTRWAWFQWGAVDYGFKPGREFRMVLLPRHLETGSRPYTALCEMSIEFSRTPKIRFTRGAR